MKINKIIILISFLIFLSNCKDSDKVNGSLYETKELIDSKGYAYQTTTNDPTGLRLYELDNGLKVYLGKNVEAPTIQTMIAVKAGYKLDPIDNTGLAHYLEHLLFKGTDKIGSLNFKKESVLLLEISDLYEQHKLEKDSVKKKEIYKIIDQKSLEASQYAIANEYDKMSASLGSTDHQAFAKKEQTVYQEKIPSNELDKWLLLQSERFSKLVLRGFHTELEAVYEEFNRGQDNDKWAQEDALLAGLYPSHPYGYQFGIGTAEHLKNPSMKAVQGYFDKYYVPNNMALIMVGDIDYASTIEKIDHAFGSYKKKDIVFPSFKKADSITHPVKKEVFGPSSESIYVAFRTEGIGSKQEILVTLIDYMLTNSDAGLIDLNLNQKQVVQSAFSSSRFDKDYGYHLLGGYPKEGQSLDDVRELLLAQIEKVKKGEFAGWILKAVVNDLKLFQLEKYEQTSSTASEYLTAYIGNQDWQNRLRMLEEMSKITKKEIVDFANEFYGANYVEVHKLKGEDKNKIKLESPKISPIHLNKDKESEFSKEFTAKESAFLSPKFIDYKTAIQRTKTSMGLLFEHVENPNNDIFNLDIIFDMGKDHDLEMSLAADYAKYLGTDRYTPEQLKQEFYKIGIRYHFYVKRDKIYANLQGLNENLDAGLALFEHYWTNMQPNQELYTKHIANISKDRENKKIDKNYILFNGLWNYAKYGDNSALRNIQSISKLQSINAQNLVDKIKGLRDFEHRIFYYGKKPREAIQSLDKYHKIATILKPYPKKSEFKESEAKSKVYFVDHDMVQTEVILVAKAFPFDPQKIAATKMFDAYFGTEMFSVLFQEIRESKALAYAVYSKLYGATEKNQSAYIYAYMGTQTEKFPMAINSLTDLINNMPANQEIFNHAKETLLKRIASKRVTKSNIFWAFEKLKKKDIYHNNRKDIYDAINNMTLNDFMRFYNENIKNKAFNILIMANKKDIDMNFLSSLGDVEEIDVDHLLNYN